jgi:hypothetical protein
MMVIAPTITAPVPSTIDSQALSWGFGFFERWALQALGRGGRLGLGARWQLLVEFIVVGESM